MCLLEDIERKIMLIKVQKKDLTFRYVHVNGSGTLSAAIPGSNQIYLNISRVFCVYDKTNNLRKHQ